MTLYNGFYLERENDNGEYKYKVKKDIEFLNGQDYSLVYGQNYSLAFDLLNSDLDLVVASDNYCMNNFMIAFDLYDFYTGMLFRVTFQDCEDYMQGKEVTLYGHIPDEDEIEAMMEFDPEMFPSKDCFEVV